MGKVQSVVDPHWSLVHLAGHHYGDILKQMAPARHHSLAHLFKDVSPLAKINLDEAFAEGYVIAIFDPTDLNGQILMRSVSRFIADPVTGAPGPQEEEAVNIEHN